MLTKILESFSFQILPLLFLFLVPFLIFRNFFRNENQKNLSQILVQKKEEISSNLIHLKSKYKLGPEQLEIVLLDWDTLVGRLQGRTLSATHVLEAYIAKTVEATEKFNCLTDFIPEAHSWAEKLDELKEVKGPLHGIPFVVKDDFDVEGLDTTHGFVKRLYRPARETAVLVKVLQDLGAIPFAKSNVPQTLFTYGSDNPIFGTALNPLNPKLSPGGSSSGTGSVVGAFGAPFGTGTDIGGSLRIPAHFNGVASIKPTVGRVSRKGVQSALPNLVGLTAAVGIIGRTPTTVSSVFKALIESNLQQTYDPLALPIPWDEKLFSSTKKLRIGYITSIPYFPLLGDTEEIVLRAKTVLESLGHTLVPFDLPDAYEYMNILGNFLLADHSKHFRDCWKGEQVAQCVKLVWLSSLIPIWIQKLVGTVMRSQLIPFVSSKRTGVFFGSGASSSSQLWDAQGRKNVLIKQVFNEWERAGVDAVISPIMPFPAPPVDNPGLLPTAVPYSVIWNLVEFPCGMVPFGYESGSKIESYNDEGDMALKLAKEGIRESIGAPIGVQVISLPFKEEIVLRVMKELEPFGAKSCGR